MIKVMVFGTFDRLHPGHRHFLAQAKRHGDYLIAVIARDRNVEKFKNKNPHDSEDERRVKIADVPAVDRAVLGQIKDVYKVIKKEQPDVICLGYDQQVNLGELKKHFTGPIIRLKAHKPEIHKTSKLK